MAHQHPLSNHRQSHTPSGFATPAPPKPSLDGSVAMEQSASSSSVSSSVASFLTAASSTSVQSSFYMPTTPKRTAHAFDPIRNNDNIHNNALLLEKDSTTFPKMSDTKTTLGISNLMSPPEHDQLDSFSINNDDDNRRDSIASVGLLETVSIYSRPQVHGSDKDPVPSKNGPLSPPISPRDQKAISASADTPVVVAQSTRDPILYPASSDTSTSPLQSRSLFSDADADVISGHVAARSPALFRQVTPPRGEHYKLALCMKSEVMQRFTEDRRGWLQQQTEQLRADRRAAAARAKRLQLPAPASKPASLPVPRYLTPRLPREEPVRQQSQGMSSHRDQMPFLQPVHDSSNRVVRRASRAPAASRGSLPTRIAPQVNGTLRHMSGSNHGNARVPGSSPEPRVRTSAPNREDKDFMALDDYCPPLSTLPERTNNLKVDWKGTPLDLSRDPYFHLLHRDEVGLAASLRLDCATYLTSKRRIFIRRLECARAPKEFRKTDAQQACKIDVNKASKLWTAYEKVGWLRMDHILPFV